MDVTLFLAQAFGLYFLIGGLGLVLNQSSLKSFIARFSSDRASVMMGGFVALLVGIPLVLIHNLWGGTLEIIVSVLVWITFIKGAVRVLVPDMLVKMSENLSNKIGMIKLMVWIMVAFGAYLTYVGFGI